MQKYFLEFFDADSETHKCLGTKSVEHNDANRRLGYMGREDLTITEPIELQRGPKLVLVKASKAKPKRLRTQLHKNEGRDEALDRTVQDLRAGLMRAAARGGE